MVERHLAKVQVAGSTPVSRSKSCCWVAHSEPETFCCRVNDENVLVPPTAKHRSQVLMLARRHLAFALAVECFHRITVEPYPPARRRRLAIAFDRSHGKPPHHSIFRNVQIRCGLFGRYGQAVLLHASALSALLADRAEIVPLALPESNLQQNTEQSDISITAALQLRLIVGCSNVVQM